MRILHAINQVCGRAGAEVSLREIVIHSTGELDHAIVVLRPEPNDLVPFEKVGVPCYVPAATVGGRLSSIQHVRSAIRDFRPDLIHTSLFDADLAGRVAAALERVPVIASFVNTPYVAEVAASDRATGKKLRVVRLIDGFLARHLTHGFHAISHAAADHAVEQLRIPRHAVRVVPRGRSREALGERTPQRRMSVRQRHGWGNRPVILNVAREEPQKGQRFLISALPSVLERRPDTLLVIAGRAGRSSAHLDAGIRDLGIGGSVQRLGVRTDVADLLSAADVFAFPSLFEGLGGAAVEALGLGLPIVASDIPALRELIGDDGGWLVPAGDSEPLAAALDDALDGGEEVQRRSRAAREAFERTYELDRCLDGMLALYRDIEMQHDETTPKRRLRGAPPFRLALVEGHPHREPGSGA